MSSLVTQEGTSLNVLAQVPGVDALQISGPEGGVESSVNLFRSDVNLPVPLVGMSGPDGLSYSLTAYLTSNVQPQVETWNQTAPTGYLGLGWSLAFESIAADNPAGRAPDEFTFYLLAGGGANRLFRTGTDSAGAWLFEAEQYEFWSIRYWPADERWEITKEDGSVSVYGGTKGAPPSTSALQFGVKWREGRGNWTGPTTETNGMSPLVVGWNLVEVRSPWGNRLRFDYDNDVRQLGSTAGLYYTAASRLVQVTDPVGQTVTLSYAEKVHDSQAREYQIPHVDPSTPDLVAYQDRFETKYLDRVTARGPAGDDGQPVLFELRMAYELCNVSLADPASPDLVKRYLTGVEVVSADGRSLPGLRFSYYNRPEDRAAEVARGALRQVWYPQGAVATYGYVRKELSGTSLETELDEAGPPAVFWGPDYGVVVLHDDDAQRLTVDVYSWNGRWVRDRLLDNVSTPFDPDTLVVGAQADFFVLSFHTPDSQLVLRKFTRIRGQFGQFEPDADWTELDIAPDGTGLVTTGEGFVVAVATGSGAQVLVWDGRAQAWQDRSETLSPSSGGRYALSSEGRNFAFADADPHTGSAQLQAFALDPVGLSFRPFSLQQQVISPILWTQASPYTLLAMGPDVLAVTWITGRTDDTVDFAIRVQQWDTELQATVVIESTRLGVPADSTLPYGQSLVAVDLVANVDRLWRFDGAVWRDATMGTGAEPAFAYGYDLALETTATDAEIWLFDPYARAWQGPVPPGRSSASGALAPTASGDTLTVGRDVYQRGPDGLLAYLGSLDANMKPGTLVNRAPAFLAYEDDAGSTRVLPMRNGALSWDEEIVLAGQHISTGGELPGDLVGGDALVTWEGADVHEPSALNLYKFLDGRLVGAAVHYPLVRIDLDVGLDPTGQDSAERIRTTSFAYDDATVTISADGSTAEFGHAAILPAFASTGWRGDWPPPEQSPLGQTRTTFHNNRSATEAELVPGPASDDPAERYYAYLHGQIAEQQDLSAQGDETRRQTWAYEVQVTRAPLSDASERQGLFGAWMRTVATETSYYYRWTDAGNQATLRSLRRGGWPRALRRRLRRSGVAQCEAPRLVRRGPTRWWLYPDAEAPLRLALRRRGDRVQVAVPVVQRRTERYSPQSGLKVQDTASYTDSRGRARLQVNDAYYAWQVPAYAAALSAAHQLAQPAVQLQRDVPADTPTADGEVTAITLRTWREWAAGRWGAVTEYLARTAAVYLPGAVPPVQFEAWGLSDPPPPLQEWVPSETVLAREPGTGEVLETRDVMGTPSSSVLDSTGTRVIATSAGAGAAAFTSLGFEAYESPGPWEMSDGSPISSARITADAHTGTASLRLAANGPALRATRDWSGTEGPLLVTCWVKTSADYGGDARWEIEAGGAVIQSVPIPATGGRWAFLSFPTDPAVRQAVRLSVRAGATAVGLDDLLVAPVHSETTAQIYGADLAPIAAVALGGQTVRTVRDRFRREVVQTNTAAQVISCRLPFLARQAVGPDAFGFPADEPNADTQLNPAGGGVMADLVQGESWREDWSEDQPGAWEVRAGALWRTGSGPSTVTWAAAGAGTDRAARVSLYLPVDGLGAPMPPTSPVGLRLGDVVATWAPGQGWALEVGGQTIASGLGDPDLPAAEWGLVASVPQGDGTSAVALYADGRVVAWTRTSGPVGGALALTAGDAGIGFRHVVVGPDPMLKTTFADGAGTGRQEQLLTDTGTLAAQSIPAADGEIVIVTKSLPKEGAFPVWDATVVTGIETPSGRMSGAVARYYSVEGGGTDDGGYPYSRKVLSDTPSRVPVIRSLPGAEFAVVFDAQGELVDPHVTTLRYGTNTTGDFGGDPFPDDAFHVEQTTDPDGRAVQVCTDLLGRRVASRASGGSALVIVRLELDASGRTTRVYLPNALQSEPPDVRFVIDSTYDFLGNAVSQSSPDTGTTRRIYDLLGQERFVLDAVGAARPPGAQVIRYRLYDRLQRVIEEGTFTGTWDEDVLQGLADEDPSWPTASDGAQPARILTFDGDGTRPHDLGQLVRAATRTGGAEVIEQMSWGLTGQVAEAAVAAGGTSTAVGFGYDAIGRTVRLQYPAGSPLPEVRYRFGRDGEIDAIGTPSDPTALAQVTYDASGAPQRRRVFLGGRTLRRSWLYNSPGWPLQITDEVEQGDTLMVETLGYTSGGYAGAGYYSGQVAVVGLERSVPDAVHFERWQLSADGLGRVVVAVEPDHPGQSATEIGYDPNGNPTRWTRDGTTRTWSYDGSDRVSEVTADGETLDMLSWDEDGRTTASTRLQISQVVYDPALALPASVAWQQTGQRFAYDAAGRRVWSEQTGLSARRTVYGTDPAPLAEISGDDAPRQYVFGPGGAVMALEGADSYALLTDHLGSVRWVGASDGTTEAAFDYLPYGELADTAGAAPERWSRRYTGQQQDPTGLYDFGARWYDPWLARFWTPDPAGQFASPYVYAGNQPFDAVDEDGEIAFLVVLAIAALVGAVIGGTVNLAMNWSGSSPGQRAAYFFIGAGFGAVAAVASVGLAAATAGLSVAAGIAVGALAEGALGAVEGYLSNGLNNTVAGKGFNENAGLAALTGGVIGGVAGGLGAAASGLRGGLRRGATALDALDDVPRGRSPLRARSRSPQGADRFRYLRNRRGRRIWVSRYSTRGSDIVDLLRSARQRGRRVTVLSGTHGDRSGGLHAERNFFRRDRGRFSSRDVRVVDVFDLSHRELEDIFNGDDEVIAAWCYSRVNRDLRRALNL
jgi:RHS repeat-associated protein